MLLYETECALGRKSVPWFPLPQAAAAPQCRPSRRGQNPGLRVPPFCPRRTWDLPNLKRIKHAPAFHSSAGGGRARPSVRRPEHWHFTPAASQQGHRRRSHPTTRGEITSHPGVAVSGFASLPAPERRRTWRARLCARSERRVAAPGTQTVQRGGTRGAPREGGTGLRQLGSVTVDNACPLSTSVSPNGD